MAKKKNTDYFGPNEEEAVRCYLSGETQEERDKVFREHLQAPINKLIESIIRTYDLHREGVSFEDLYRDTLSHLMMKADKFDKSKNTKAYSYYGTIVRNYLRNLLIEDDKKTKRNIPYEDVHYALENDRNYSYELEEDNYSLNDFLKKISGEIRKEINEEDDTKMVNKKLTENEKKVGYAVIDLLENWEEAFKDMDGGKKFNKMAVLSSLREMTGLTTKDIRIAMKRFKSIYYLLKKESMDEDLL